MSTTRRLLFVCALFAGSVGIFFLPLLWGEVLLPASSDLALYYYPAFDFYSQALHAGQSYLWTPELFSGFPMYASQVGGFFDPLNLAIFSLFSGLVGVELRLVIDILLTFVFSYMAARAMGISRQGAALVGPAYLLAFDWLYLSNPVITNSLFVLPLLLYCATRYFTSDRVVWRYLVLAGAGLGWGLLCGYTQVVFYALVLAGIYVLVLQLLSRVPLKQALTKSVLAAVLVVCTGGAVGAPQLLPALKFLPYTSRAETSSYEDITLKAIAPGDLVLAVVPPNFYVPYVTPGRKPLFVGGLWLILALGSLAVGARALWRRDFVQGNTRYLISIGVAFVFAFVAALEWSPLFWLLHKIPVFSLFRFPYRFMFLGALLLSLLGAFGLDTSVELVRLRFFRVAVYVVGAFAVLFTASLAVVQALGQSGSAVLVGRISALFSSPLVARVGFHKDPSHYVAAVQSGLAAYRELLSLGNPAVLLPLVSLLAGVAVAFWFVRGRMSADLFGRAAMVVMVFTIASVGIAGWGAFASHSLYGYPDPFASRLAVDAGPYRVYSFLVADAANPYIPPQYKLSPSEQLAIQQLSSAGEVPNLSIIHGLRSVDGYDQFEPQATLNELAHIGGELGAGYAASSSQERTSSLLSNLQILGGMGGKYVLSGVPLASPTLKFIATSSVTTYGMTLYLYEYPQALPLYFIAASGCTNCRPDNRSVLNTLSTNGTYRFTTTLTAPGTLVLLESNLPGWVATIDGVAAPVRLVNGLYLGVGIPAGQHTTTLEYRGILGELQVLRALGIVRK